MKLGQLAFVCAAGLGAASCMTTGATVESISQPGWALKGPNARDYAMVFPVEAYRRGVSGAAMLLCVIRADRGLDCTIERETPPGAGFGAAAMTLSHAYVVRDAGDNPVLATGRTIRVPFKFVNPG